MKIGARLTTIAGLVPSGSRLADVGTDHAYLPVWLIKEGVINRAIASDIAEGPCAAARATVALAGTDKAVEVRKGDGLSCLAPGEINTVVIAGMGGTTIIEILQAQPQVTEGIDTFILQPMVGASQLREWINRQGLDLADELLCEESGRIYVVLLVKRPSTPMSQPVFNREELEVGPCLIKKGGALYERYLEQLLQHHHYLLQQMQDSKSARESGKYQELAALVQRLEVLKDACHRS